MARGIAEPRTPNEVPYVGTIVGESTSREFRLALAHESVREQDIIAVDADLRRPDSDETEGIRVWAKVQRIERVNPLFPHEAGHELAATQTHPLDTVLSLSREMVTAVCQVLGTEPRDNPQGGRLDHLRYPAQPATSAYRPATGDIARIVIGDLEETRHRGLDLATLSNRPEVSVVVDGHAVVTRHLAILAMTGAGKSWTSRRIIEELAGRNYPIIIFDPHGDYTGLAEVEHLKGRVQRFYAEFPIFEQSAETVATIVENLGFPLAKTHRERFELLFNATRHFLAVDAAKLQQRAGWMATYLSKPDIGKYGIVPNLFAMANVVEAVSKSCREEDSEALDTLVEWTGTDEIRFSKQVGTWIAGLSGNLGFTAAKLLKMQQINRKVSGAAEPLPTDRSALVRYRQISIVGLAGYTGEFQATIYSIIAEEVFGKRVSGELRLPVLFVLEEAHNFAPAKAMTDAEKRSISTTKQIAQEGRKFGVGQVLISQRPSRLDETTLSQCNSFVIMRMVNPADQSYVKRVIETLGEDEVKLLPDLDIGEALLSGQFINFPVLVKIKEPRSQGEREEKDAFQSLEEAHRAGEPSAKGRRSRQ